MYNNCYFHFKGFKNRTVSSPNCFLYYLSIIVQQIFPKLCCLNNNQRSLSLAGCGSGILEQLSWVVLVEVPPEAGAKVLATTAAWEGLGLEDALRDDSRVQRGCGGRDPVFCTQTSPEAALVPS